MVPAVGNQFGAALAARGLTAIGTLWGLGELLVAGLVGARLYREPEPA